VTSIDDLERRIAALEQQSVADSIQSNIFTVGPGGIISGLNLPVAQFSSSIRWIRQSDGSTLASIGEQQFSTAPNRQQRLQLIAQEPVDIGPNVDASISAGVAIANPNVFIARNILEVGGTGLYGAVAGTPVSDFLLKEQMTFTLMSGTPNGFVIDANFRIYNLTGAITFQNSSINPNSPWAIAGRLSMPISGGAMILTGQQGGVSGTSLGVFAAINGGAIVPAGNAGVSNFASSPANSNMANICFVRQPTGQAIQWSGWNGNVTPTAYLGMFAVPFDQESL